MDEREMVEAIRTILEKHEVHANMEGGGERPFVEDGEVIEAISEVLVGNDEWVRKVGWLS